MNTIPNLTGKVCESLVQQEYWYKGEKTPGVHILFLKIKKGNWHRFFFDCGVLFWREVDAPDTWHTAPTDEHHYSQRTITDEHHLSGRLITKIEARDERYWPDLFIEFSNGTTLILRDFCNYQLLEFQKVQ